MDLILNRRNGKLTDCITTAGHIYYGLTWKEVMKPAFQFMKELAKKYCNS
jgi:hypothetical protein